MSLIQQALLALEQKKRTPLAGLLEGFAGGVSQAQDQSLERAKTMLLMQQEMENRQRLLEEDKRIRQRLANSTETNTVNGLHSVATPATSPIPAQRMEHTLQKDGKTGLYSESIKIVPPKEPSVPDSYEKVLAEQYRQGKITLEQFGEMRRSATDSGASKPPSGYRWKKDGTQEPIPGGPGDKLNTLTKLPPATVLVLNEGKNVARMLPDVEAAIKTNEGKFGPVTGRIRGANPYDESAQTFEAKMRTASQSFGRFMEGGVLRKEDEIKYLRMFPQTKDTDAVKKNKLSIIRRDLAKKYEDDRKTLGASGYDVSGFEELDIPTSIFEEEAPTDKRNQSSGAGGAGWSPDKESRYQELLRKRGKS